MSGEIIIWHLVTGFLAGTAMMRAFFRAAATTESEKIERAIWACAFAISLIAIAVLRISK